MSEVEIHAGSALAIRREQSDWTPEQGTALLEMFNLSQAPLPVIRSYFHVCQTTGLDPFKRQIHLIERGGKWTPQTAIDGFRIIRDRSGVFDGGEISWCGDDGVWRDVWLDEKPPSAARYALYRTDHRLPDVATALWSAYVQTKGNGQVTHMWGKMSAHMLAKVAEALAIRMAFPDDTGGLYTDDEMAQATAIDDGPARRERSPGIQDLLTPPVAPPVQQAPAAPVGGGFMDAGQSAPAAPATVHDPNVEDAVIVPDDATATEQPAEVPMALSEPDPVPAPAEDHTMAPVLDMQPEPEAARPLSWSQRLAEFCEQEAPQVGVLRAMFDEASAAGAQDERVPWAGENATLASTIFQIRDRLESGQTAWA